MPRAVPGHWRVAFVMAVAALALLAGSDRRTDPLSGVTSLLVGLQDGAGEQDIARVAGKFGARTVSHNQDLRIAVVEVHAGTAGAVISALERSPAVRYAGANTRVATAAAPTDEYYLQGQQWNIDRVKAPEAWDLLPPGGNTIVAVIDTGIDYGHPEFAGRVSQSGCDQFHGDCLGSGGGTQARDDNGHGTHVAGIIGANSNNRTGIASVSGGRVTIIPVKALSKGGGGYTSDVLDAVSYAVNKGAKVINMSLGGPCGETPRALDDAWRDAIVYAEQRDALIVKSAGNDGGCWEGRYPDTDSRVLSVAATDVADGSPIFTSRGAWVKVAAPGHRILSTVPVARGSYATFSGTSMASPHVAGQAALLFQVPGATKAKVMEWITSTCDSALVSVQCGGRINVYRSVHLAVKGVDPAKAPAAPADAPPAAAPAPSAPPVGRFAAPALPLGFTAPAAARAAQVPASASGNGANVAWNGAFWLSAPNLTVGVCSVDDEATRTAAAAALRRLADAQTRGLAWQITGDDAACDSSFSQPKLLIMRDALTDDTVTAAKTGVRDLAGAPCDVGTGTSGCWANAGTIMINPAAFDKLTEEQQSLTILREITRALGLSHAATCAGSLLISPDRCPDTNPVDLGADDIASLNELLGVALKALNG